MVEKINFTKQWIESLPTPEKRIKYQDKECKYLYLECHPSGKKVFMYVRCIDYKTTQIKVGYWPEFNVFLARQEAGKMSTEFAKGNNPLLKRKEKRIGETFEEIFSHYLEQHLKVNCRTWKEDIKRFGYCGDISKKLAKEITNTDIFALHRKISSRNGSVIANRVIQLIRRTYNYAIASGANLTNPAAGFKKTKEESRERFLDAVELKRFFTALSREKKVWQDFFCILLFTGARRSNVLAMKWRDIDIERRIWIIPKEEFKTGKSKDVVLSQTVIDILLERFKTNAGEWVFPSYSGSGHLAEPKMTWENIRKNACLNNVRIHDLRRTFGSWQAATGASLSVIGKALGHDNTQTTAIYARLNTSSIKEAVEKATQAMLEAAR